MIPTLFFYELGLAALVWLFLMLYWLWPNDPATRYPTRPQLRVPRKRSNAPKLFVGLPHRPHCALYEQDSWFPKGCLRHHSIHCPCAIDAPAQWTPRGTFARMTAVTIAAGWG